MPLGDLLGEAGFGLLTDQHLQILSREVGFALGNSAGEPGFGFLTVIGLLLSNRKGTIEG